MIGGWERGYQFTIIYNKNDSIIIQIQLEEYIVIINSRLLKKACKERL